MVAAEFVVHLLIELAVGAAIVHRDVPAVVGGEFLLDDVGLDRDAEMIRLTGQIGCSVVVGAPDLEIVASQVAPQDGRHTEFMAKAKASAISWI